MTAATKPRILRAVPDTPLASVTALPIETEPDWDTPLTADDEDANNAAYNPDAENGIEDAFERALDRIKRGDPLKVVIADAFRVGVFHGYASRLHDERVSREVENIVTALDARRGGGDTA